MKTKKLYQETKNNVILTNRQLNILQAVLGYIASNLDDLNEAFRDDEEDLLRVGESYMSEVNELEIENLRMLVDSIPI